MSHPTTKPLARINKLTEQVRQHSLSFPSTREDMPWGHSAFKVGKKAFVFMYADGEGFSLSFKLKRSHFEALELPFTKPTEYGLGKHGWVSAWFGNKDDVPMGLLEQWIDESYRLIAPQKFVKSLDGAAPAPAKVKAKPRAKGKTTSKKAAQTTSRRKKG